MTQPPNPHLVLVVATVLPGMGQVMNRQPLRGLIFVFFIILLGAFTLKTAAPDVSFVGKMAGGLFVWARLTGAGGKVSDGGEFAKRAIEKGVAFVPGAPFFCANPDPSTLRLSFATVGADKIVEGVGRLAQAL